MVAFAPEKKGGEPERVEPKGRGFETLPTVRNVPHAESGRSCGLGRRDAASLRAASLESLDSRPLATGHSSP